MSGVQHATNFDDLTIRCARALMCSESEWRDAQLGTGMQGVASALSDETEKLTLQLLQALCSSELNTKPTTLSEDEETFRIHSQSSNGKDAKLVSALEFRIEKKKILSL